MKILITGGPKTGKTTLARKRAENYGLKHLCTDPQKLCPDGVSGTPDGLQWSEASAFVAKEWLGQEDTIIEGIAIPRALRKWKEAHPGSPPPCDQLIILDRHHLELSEGQASMSKGVHTVLDELWDWLKPVIK